MIRPFGRSGWSYNYIEIKMWQYSHYNSEVVTKYFYGITARVRVNSFMDPFSHMIPTKRAALPHVNNNRENKQVFIFDSVFLTLPANCQFSQWIGHNRYTDRKQMLVVSSYQHALFL